MSSPREILDVDCCPGGTEANLAIKVVEGARFIRLLRMSVSSRYISHPVLQVDRCLGHVAHRYPPSDDPSPRRRRHATLQPGPERPMVARMLLLPALASPVRSRSLAPQQVFPG